MTSAFARFSPRLQEAIVSRLGWTALRPVQELASHALLDGQNAVILAPTAGGKTEASMFPLLSMLMEQEPQGVGLIYIAPIKALLNNQAERLGMYTEMVGLRRFLWHGDVKASDKRKFIKEPATVLMTTPESLEVMLLSARVPHAKLFGDLRAVVIDEIHALAGSDRGTHLLSVLERIARHTPNDIQRIGLSATVGNPEEILTWLQGTSKRAGSVIDPPKQPAPKDLRVYLRNTTMAIAQDASRKAAGKKKSLFSAKVAPWLKTSPNGSATGAPTYLFTTAPSPWKNAMRQKPAFTRAPTPALSAPPLWNWVSMSAIWIWCSRPMPPQPSPPFSSGLDAPGDEPDSEPTPRSSVRIWNPPSRRSPLLN